MTNDYTASAVLEATQISQYVTAVGIYKFLDTQSQQLKAQEEFLKTAADRLIGIRARLAVVEDRRITARKEVQALEERLPMAMIARLGRIPGDPVTEHAMELVREPS